MKPSAAPATHRSRDCKGAVVCLPAVPLLAADNVPAVAREFLLNIAADRSAEGAAAGQTPWSARVPLDPPADRSSIFAGGRPRTRASAPQLMVCFAAIALLSACGYRVGGHAAPDVIPATIKTIAIPPIVNNSMRPRLPAMLAADLTREFHSRTKYIIISDPTQADATLKATIAKVVNFPTIADPTTGNATGAGVVVTMNLTLTDRSGKVLFSQVGTEYRERYEISLDPKTYFDESDTALIRLSRDLANGIVTAILEKF